MSSNLRKIIHIDMDAFYASVEQRDCPEYRGKPLAVGGSPDGRGVVAAASYEARKFGIRSAMSARQARRLCPEAIFVKPRFDVYRAVSQQVMAVFHRYTDFVEPLSLDEAYLDVTDNKIEQPYATEVAKLIKADIVRETGLTASAGVAPNKFLAKIASDMNKPDGITVVKPHQVEDLLETLPVRKVPGIGRVTEEKLVGIGIPTIGHLRRRSEEELVKRFGKHGNWYYRIARGIDERRVQVSRERKSISVERTFGSDLSGIEEMKEQISLLAIELERRMQKRDLRGRTLTLKIKFNDFSQITRGSTSEEAFCDGKLIESIAVDLLERSLQTDRGVRLLGIGLSNLNSDEVEERPCSWQQLEFSF